MKDPNLTWEEYAKNLEMSATHMEKSFQAFKLCAEKRRDEIQKALAGLATSMARGFEGTHTQRHTAMASAMAQIPNISALCEKIPDLLVDAANDIPF